LGRFYDDGASKKEIATLVAVWVGLDVVLPLLVTLFSWLKRKKARQQQKKAKDVFLQNAWQRAKPLSVPHPLVITQIGGDTMAA